MFNDGILKIYQKVISDDNRGVMSKTLLELIGEAFYGEMSFTAVEHYEAKQSETAIDKRVRIHQNKNICNKHVIVLDDTQYDVGRTYSSIVRGIAVTEITLERVTTQYDIAGT
jgi:SPP1 family predicted phage head-tail adaptor